MVMASKIITLFATDIEGREVLKKNKAEILVPSGELYENKYAIMSSTLGFV